MKEEIKQCQNCKQDFVIEPEDFTFYERMRVPPPTWCPDCRLQRRLAWRNERTLYKTKCGNCKKDIFSAYPSDKPFPVFCHDCWFSDAWDPMAYGRDYDFSKPFFEQWGELFQEVPRLNLWQLNCVNSPYSNIIRDAKNCYLAFSMVGGEEVFYSKIVDHSKQIFDSLLVVDSERCTGVIYGAKNYNVQNSLSVNSCLDSSFLFDCRNARNCFMSSNLRNKEYVFRNNQLTKERYIEGMKKINSGSYSVFQGLKRDFDEMLLRSVHEYVDNNKAVGSTGDKIMNVRNVKDSFESYEMENCRYMGRALQIDDSMDCTYTGVGSESVYEYTSGGKAMQNIKFAIACFGGESNCTYVGWCKSSSNLFGCFGVRDKSYCILNKQYSESEYKELAPKIIEHMNTMPYIGKNGRVYQYGEFFPIELSPFSYNGSVAQEHFPFTREEILTRGYHYREPDAKNPVIDTKSEELPDDIASVGDDIVNKSFACAHAGGCVHQCTVAFKVVPQELAMYRQFKIPLPRLCPNCRHYERLKYRNPWKLWHRKCQCAGAKSDNSAYQNTIAHAHHGTAPCPNEFETSYVPDRKETVYCEQCYNAEVV
jgi:hypothetical protein